MIKYLSLFFALTLNFALAAQPLEFKITNDHTNLIYRVGEDAIFEVTATDTNGVKVKEGALTLTLDNYGSKQQLKRTVDLAVENPFKVTGRLDEPGFLCLRLNAADTKEKVWSVGYEPEKICKGSPSPADFDEFWQAARAKLAREVPLDAKIERIEERCCKKFDFYRISFAVFSRRVYGYMTVPTDKKLAPFPVEFTVAAAGFGDWTNNLSGDQSRIRVLFSVYPFEPHWQWREKGLKKSTYAVMNDKYNERYGVPGYSCAGISESREAYFFYEVILGIDRAVDWVASRPDVDRSRFCYQGTSQGGGFGFYLTALNRTFTRAVFFVPALTDTMGYLKERRSGWPKIVESHPKELKAAAAKNAPYFDAANFASRIRIPVRVAVGFADEACPPCAVYAAYNEIKVSDKGIENGFGMPHSCYQEIYTKLRQWLFAQEMKGNRR